MSVGPSVGTQLTLYIQVGVCLHVSVDAAKCAHRAKGLHRVSRASTYS